MKKIKAGWIIHIFALLHAAIALVCRLCGVEDELLLTILTMMMALLICLRRGLNVEFAAASIIMVNIIGFLLGKAGAAAISYIIDSAYVANALATTITTEVLGWSIVAFSKIVSTNRKESRPLSYRFLKWIILAMVAAFSLRVGIIFLISSGIFADGAMAQAFSLLFSNSFAIITMLCLNVIYVRYQTGFIRRVGDGMQMFLLTVFMLGSAFVGAGISSLGLSFDISVDSWTEFIQLYIVTLVAQLAVYCIIFMVNYAISANNKMNEEKEKKHVAQYRYQKLKRQVNPHFLFNCLNALDCLVWEEKPEQTSIYIRKLASVYRYMLKSEEEDFVTLEEELTFVNMYVDLLKVRFPEGYEVVIDVRDDDKARFVLPCSIQLLIENASKHNAVAAENPLVIKVVSDGTRVKVTNNIIPKVTKIQSTGLGQKYIRQQYKDLSGKEIAIDKTENEYCVTLPLL